MNNKRNNGPPSWYDKNGKPRWESFKTTVSQVVRDLREVDQREMGAGETEVRHVDILREAMATKENRSAVVVAWRIKHNDFAPLANILPTVADKTRFLQKVVDALSMIDGKGKSSFEPKPSTLNIVESYYAAVDQLHQKYFPEGEGIYLPDEFADDPTIPTLAELKEQFVRRFPGTDKLPADWTIRKTLKRLKLRLREGERGRPKKIAPRQRV